MGSSHLGSRVEDAEQVRPWDLRGAPYRPRPARVRDDVAPAASRRRACRQRCSSGASPNRMSEESQRAWNQFQTPPTRYEATGDLGRKTKAFRTHSSVTFGFVRRALSTHSITLMSLAGKIVRSLPVLKNHAYEARVGSKILRQVLQLLRQLRSALLIDRDERAVV